MTKAGQPDIEHQQPPQQRLLELVWWRPRSWGVQHVVKSQASVTMAKDAAGVEHHLKSANDSVSNLYSDTFLSFSGGGPQVGGADHLRPVDQRAVCWRGLHIEHIQGSLQNWGTVFSQICTPSTLTHSKQPTERGNWFAVKSVHIVYFIATKPDRSCRGEGRWEGAGHVCQPADTFLQLSGYIRYDIFTEVGSEG